MNPYVELGVAPDATPDDIRAAYRKMAMAHHPDRQGGSHETFQRVQAAYDLLSDEARRKRYDETGATTNEPTLQEKATQALHQLVNEVIDKMHDLDYSDPLAVCRNDLHTALKHNDAGIEKEQGRIKQRQKALKRLQRKGEGADHVRLAIEGAIAQLEQNIKQIAAMSDLCRAILDILAEYDYELDDASMEDRQVFLTNEDLRQVFRKYAP